MKKTVCILLLLSLLTGCTQEIIVPTISTVEASTAVPTATVPPTPAPTEAPPTPAPTMTSRPALLATYAPKGEREALFPEELLSLDGEPIASLIRSLLSAMDISKSDFHDRFTQMLHRVDKLNDSILDLSGRGRTLTADRREATVAALTQLMDQKTLDALQEAYSTCSGEGEDLPLPAYTASMDALLQNIQRMEERTSPFFEMGTDVAREYRAVLVRYMGEPVVPQDVFNALEALAQTEAYAIAAALNADPEVARRKEPISFGSFAENMAFLRKVTETLCPLPDGSALAVPYGGDAEQEMELPELAFRYYPGMAFLKAYASQETESQQARWANAPDGYMAGLAVHCSYAVIPYIDEFGLDYMQYRWYEDMLDVTLTGITALLIHYYGYSTGELAAYLKGWGAEDFTGYLYEKAMDDPFESLVASYGYYRYLDICQAALDAGCPDEQQFLRDYLAAGPAPFAALKEYMVRLYQNEG